MHHPSHWNTPRQDSIDVYNENIPFSLAFRNPSGLEGMHLQQQAAWIQSTNSSVKQLVNQERYSQQGHSFYKPDRVVKMYSADVWGDQVDDI